jgi:hypothetical protein
MPGTALHDQWKCSSHRNPRSRWLGLLRCLIHCVHGEKSILSKSEGPKSEIPVWAERAAGTELGGLDAFVGGEAETGVVGGPLASSVREFGAQSFLDFGKIGGPFDGGQG